jgi:hypothetical protein
VPPFITLTYVEKLARELGIPLEFGGKDLCRVETRQQNSCQLLCAGPASGCAAAIMSIMFIVIGGD